MKRILIRAAIDYAAICSGGYAIWTAYGMAAGLAAIVAISVYGLWCFWDGTL